MADCDRLRKSSKETHVVYLISWICDVFLNETLFLRTGAKTCIKEIQIYYQEPYSFSKKIFRILLWTFLNSLHVVESMISFQPAFSESSESDIINVVSRPSTEVSPLACSVVSAVLLLENGLWSLGMC